MRGFSAAANKLFMSQPSVSHHVRQLETAVDAVLIDRSSGRARATAEGEVLAEYARRFILLGEEAITAVRQVQGLGRGHLTLGGTTTVGSYLLPHLLGQFQQRHPDIECSLYVGNVEQLTARVLSGEVGLGVFAGHPSTTQLQVERVLMDLAVIVAAPGHPLAYRLVAANELRTQRFILREQGSGTRSLQAEALSGWQLPDVASMEMWGTETIKQAVKAGLGISLLSEHTVRQEVRDGLLATIAVQPAATGRPIVAAYRRERALAPTERAFLADLRALNGWPGASEAGDAATAIADLLGSTAAR
ncbi:LysR family transcriptional regulator [Mycolicibacterium litorale]|nr:LysR family transcriptional regulator [Mycolicibacterium litorale]